MKIKRALVSVSDKEGIVELCSKLHQQGVEIISTGGTARQLKLNNIPVKQVEEVTGSPEMLNGRVKTLHPKIHAAILAEKDNVKHLQDLKDQQITPIDLVVVNLYPFKEVISEEGVVLEKAIENIDIGGPTMIRAAAKNYQSVAVVVSPKQYNKIILELEKGGISLETKKQLAKEAFEYTAAYDALITDFLTKRLFPKTHFPDKITFTYEKVQECRYGENPHQKAAVYKSPIIREPCAAKFEQLNGKELSFNNLNDLNGAIELVKEFEEPTVVISKHTNPCGVASDFSLSQAFKNALECDPISAFGGIIVMNYPCDLETAKQITSFFNEIVAAPSFDDSALEELQNKEKLRVLKIKGLDIPSKPTELDLKKIVGGMLVQERDSGFIKDIDLNFVTTKPNKEQLESLLFAWKVCKHVKSNAIVLAEGKKTVGIGAGQMSRIDSVNIALHKAAEKVSGAVMASDAFFPFRDSIDTAASAGIKAIIQPGGSIKDQEVIDAANEHEISMVFTGRRHFKH